MGGGVSAPDHMSEQEAGWLAGSKHDCAVFDAVCVSGAPPRAAPYLPDSDKARSVAMYTTMAQRLERRGDFDGALKLHSQALAAAPSATLSGSGDASATVLVAGIHRQMGDVLLRQGKLDAATARCAVSPPSHLHPTAP
jgi:hypothetical protein